jgi:phosphate transport system substrate-binding protein
MKTTIVTLLATVGLIFASATHAERLVIKGSDTLGAKLVPQLAEQFKTQNLAPLSISRRKVRLPASRR